MKKFIFTLAAMMFITLGAHAFNYDSNGPSNSFGGNLNLFNTTPTMGGSAEAYQNAVNASYYRGMNEVNVNHYYNDDNSSKNVSPRKQRKHGSAANKRRH